MNKNTNELVPQYFPKGRDFDKLTEKDVQRVEGLLITGHVELSIITHPTRSSPNSKPHPKIMHLVCELRKVKISIELSTEDLNFRALDYQSN